MPRRVSLISYRLVYLAWLFSGALSACQDHEAAFDTPALPGAATSNSTSDFSCPESEAVWAMHPEDPAIMGTPSYGYYYVNEDRSIWASAWWWESDEYPLRAGKEGIKVGWFRPVGETLVVAGTRLNGEPARFEAHIPCCYPSRFQSSGLYFPEAGCWEITARAANSRLSFIVQVEP